jgi:hypothetical protein
MSSLAGDFSDWDADEAECLRLGQAMLKDKEHERTAHKVLLDSLPHLTERLAQHVAEHELAGMRSATYAIGQLTESPASAFPLRVLCYIVADEIAGACAPPRMYYLLTLLQAECARLLKNQEFPDAELVAEMHSYLGLAKLGASDA